MAQVLARADALMIIVSAWVKIHILEAKRFFFSLRCIFAGPEGSSRVRTLSMHKPRVDPVDPSISPIELTLAHALLS